MGALDDEPVWIRRSVQGDPDAFGALVERYQRMVHALAYRMTGSLDAADDLAQETFVQAFRRLNTYRAESRFSSWLGRIAVHLALNWTQSEQRRQRLYRHWAEHAPLVSSSPPDCDGPADRIQRAEEALLRLHPKQRAAVVLTIYDGMTHAEAAQALGCSETTVSWRLFAARARLKRWLQ
jgi:RNA polymerase sigma-70 factor (ECF subfamily)